MSSGSFRDRYGRWAVVAGASVGLGAAFAEKLAGRGLDLVLVARRAELLEALAARLRTEHGVQIRTASIDLGAPDLAARMDEATRDLDVGLLVYNAALSLIGPFLDHDLDAKLRLVDVNCRGPLILSHHFGARMAARGRGGIVIMSSLAAGQGSPLVTTYAATKAFDRVLAEGLWYELAPRGVDVVTCRAGATRTPNFEESKPAGRVPVMEPGPVVDEALDALGKKPSMVPGWTNRLASFAMERLLPRATAIRVMGSQARKLYGR